MNHPGKLAQGYLGLVAFSLAGSALSQATGLDPGPIAPIASGLTILVGLAAVFRASQRDRSIQLAAVGVLLLGAAVEVVGLETGFPFGYYAYTERWQPTVPVLGHPFPVLLPFAWLLVSGAAFFVAVRWVGGSIGAVPAAAAIATAVDVPMEWTMAGGLRYWVWLERGPLPGGAPVANLLGWFGTSLLASLIFYLGGAAKRRGK
ncbi:MAG TPA: carotenoid biosynthesis protein, partial [Fimbriimonas sp.]